MGAVVLTSPPGSQFRSWAPFSFFLQRRQRLSLGFLEIYLVLDPMTPGRSRGRATLTAATTGAVWLTMLVPPDQARRQAPASLTATVENVQELRQSAPTVTASSRVTSLNRER